MYQASFQPKSNREDWEFIFSAADEDTNDDLDLSSADIVFQLNDSQGCEKLTASLLNRQITLVETNTFKIFIPRSSTASLCAGTYQVGITIENEGLTEQVLVGSIPVVDGEVQR